MKKFEEEFGYKVSKNYSKLCEIFKNAKIQIIIFGFSESYETLRNNITIDNFNDSGDICITSPNGDYVLVTMSMLISHCMEFDITFIDPNPPNPNAIFYADGSEVQVGDKVKSIVGKKLIRENTITAYRGCLAFERETEKYPAIIANCGYIEWDNNRMVNVEKVEEEI